MKWTVCAVLCLIGAVTAVAPFSAAEEKALEAAAPDPAMESLMRTAHFLAQLKEFRVHMRIGYDVVQESGQKIEFGERRTWTVVRPDRFRADVERSDGEKAAIVFDGKAITVYHPNLNMYAVSEISGDIDTAVKHLIKDLNVRMPLSLLLVTSLPKELEKRVVRADLVETSVLEGTPCAHLAVRGDAVDFQMWVPIEGDPLPRRIVLTYKNDEGQPQFWANFSDWNLTPNPPADFFSLDIPKDASRIQFLAQVRQSMTPAKPAEKKGGAK
uniref:DUF2092 domain-containing protein n=1 Tax=Desulfacinum infernum TaxID=35837 RepID=A0A832A216_9BACT